MLKKIVSFIFIISFFFLALITQTKAQPLEIDQMACSLSGGDVNDPMYKKYFDICWKQTGAKSTGAIIDCMNTYPEFVEWDNQNKEKCLSSSPTPVPSGLSTEAYLDCIDKVLKEVEDKFGLCTSKQKCWGLTPEAEEEAQKEFKRRCDGISQGQTSAPSPAQNEQNPYAACASDCADQVEAKYQCPFNGPLDSCVSDKISYQSVCQDACWDSWRPPSEPMLSEGGAQIEKIEQNGKTALLIAGYDRSVNDSVMDHMKNYLADWDPDNQLTAPSRTSDIPLGLGVLSLDGDVDIKRPGSNVWETLRKGTSIPEGSKVFTGIEGNVWIYGKFGIANIKHGSYVTITKDSASQGKDPNVRFDIQVGEVEIRYEKANYYGIIQTRTPSAIAQVKGTKFFTSYNQEQKYSAVGVYEGQVEVQSMISGEKIELSSTNAAEPSLAFIPLPKPLDKNEPVAVAAIPVTQKPKSNLAIIILTVVILGLITTGFILYRKRKLLPSSNKDKEKMSAVVKKTETDKKL